MIRTVLAALLAVTLAVAARADAQDAPATPDTSARTAPATPDTSAYTAPAARADAPAPDTTLGGYLRTLADSSDAYFGAIAAPTDTAGLDSARIEALEHPRMWPPFSPNRLSYFPVLAFNRVDGPVLGGGVGYGRATRMGHFEGRLATATGPNLTLGRLSYEKRLVRPGSTWGFRALGGRRTMTMDRDPVDAELSALRAFLNGADRKHYLRRDGVEARIFREGGAHRLGLAYRDMLESPRTTTATWNLFDRPLLVPGNLAAWTGRAREIEFEALARVPHTPAVVQLLHVNSGRGLSSTFDYRRTLVSGAIDVGLSRSISWLPQAELGRLDGDPVPQQSFYLGGPSRLRSLGGESLGGARIAFARSEWLYLRDILGFARRQGRSAMPIHLGVFAATGAVWGRDPYTGVTPHADGWRDGASWRSEAGFSLLYQPGLPQPTDFVRIHFAWPLGPGDGSRISMSFGRAMDLLRPFERD